MTRGGHLHPDDPKLSRGGGSTTFLLEGVALVRADSLEDAQRTLSELCRIISERGLPPFATRIERCTVVQEGN
ncbi:MAG: hypothetical protein ACRDM7_15945 [Thermoleophilaceae bacterium]